jgi:tetratricopeptide (TPR) repeat protein
VVHTSWFTYKRSISGRGSAVRAAILGLLLSLAWTAPSFAQHAVERASAFRDQRDFAGAVALLREHLAQHPDDASAARMLAETLYWTGDVAAAQREYEAALTRFPSDTHLRLDYARFLMETRRYPRARAVLHALRGAAGEREADVEAMLGTLAYWTGDLGAASAHFRIALGHRPDHAEARRQLAEIRQLSAPWVAVGARVREDDQPLRRALAFAEAGWFLTPAHQLVLQAAPQWYDVPGASALQGGLLLQSAWPATGLQTSLGVGLARHGVEAEQEITGRAGLSLRLPRGFGAHLLGERERYDWTLASLETPLVTNSATGRLSWEAAGGWLAEASATIRRFPDDNQVTSVHGWALAPLVRRQGLELSAGYSVSYADAEESRWVPASPDLVQEGRYAPYHTPHDQRIHSALAAFRLPLGASASVRASAAYGFHAREQAPDGVLGDRWTYERGFNPWNAGASLGLQLRPGLAAEISGEHSRTAHYQVNAGGIRLTYRPVY